jgi:ABC-type Fe3+-hydroxamate transport system substrate-binding protein
MHCSHLRPHPRLSVIALSLALLTSACATRGDLPLASGQYTFRQRYVEHPDMQGARFEVKIGGNRIVVTNPVQQGPFAAGEIESGTLERHAKSGRWIIVQTPADREAEEVGGCSDGPTEVDPKKRIYWTC